MPIVPLKTGLIAYRFGDTALGALSTALVHEHRPQAASAQDRPEQ